MSVDARHVRAWAVAEGFDVPSRGRLPRDVVAQYLRAHPREGRALAAELGIDVAARGPLSYDTCVQLAAG